MAQQQGRLYTKSSNEGGADAIYDGAAKSSFAIDKAGKASNNFAAANPRFSAPHSDTPVEVDVAPRGIADSVGNKRNSANFAQAKPRFEEPKAETPGSVYAPKPGAFDSALASRPSHTMMSGDNEKGRDSWMQKKEHQETPGAYYNAPGAFDNLKGGVSFDRAHTDTNSRQQVTESAPDVELPFVGIGNVANKRGSSTFATDKPRFQETISETPGATYQPQEGAFDKALANAKKPTMVIGEHEKPRGAWMDRHDQIESPAAVYEAPGAFDAALKPGTSTFGNSAAPRFKEVYSANISGEPSSAPVSAFDFAKASKPTPEMMASNQRFKEQYNVPSYGDPGATNVHK